MKQKLQVGIIGAGYWGPNLARNYYEIDECDLLWVCDLSGDRLEYISEKFPGVKVTQDYGQVLDDGNVDAVVISTPVGTHFEIAKSVMEARKHAFIEKPMTSKAVEGLELVRLAEEAGLKIGTGHIFLYHPAVAKMKEVLSWGKIGRLYYAHSARMNPAPSHGNVDVIWDLAVHDVSIALYLWDQVPERVRASGAMFAHGKRADVTTLELYFPDGTLTYHHVGWLTSIKERCFFLAGKNGSMKFDETADEKLRIVGPPMDTRLDADAQKGHIFYAPGKIEAVELSGAEPLKKECEDFIHAVLNQKDMISDGLFGHSVVRVLEAASLSLSNGGEMIALEGTR